MLKPIAFYLPQFHSIPENDEVWGEGFTEWNSVKAAKKIVDGQNQPRIPLDENYYNLLNEDTIEWQTRIAKENGVFGFCIYHYWFSGKLLLNKPLEIMKNSKKINFPYCICWANESWTDAWQATGKPKTFLNQKYGNKDEWTEHFKYLLQFFKDPNYIIEDNKPFFVIYRPESIPNLNECLEYWNELARDNGFDGITFAYQQIDFEKQSNKDDSMFKYSIEYQPKYALTDYEDDQKEKSNPVKTKVKAVLKKSIISIDSFFNLKIMSNRREKKGPRVLSYENIANKVLERKGTDKSIAGMFVGYDDTPRKGNKGMIIQSTPSEFARFMMEQAKNIKTNYTNEYVFLFAWNEWGESGYLEPDSKFKYQYLSAVKDAVNGFERL